MFFLTTKDTPSKGKEKEKKKQAVEIYRDIYG